MNLPIGRVCMLAWAFAALGLVACGQSGQGTASQVVLKVNDGEVSVHQVELALRQQGAVAPAGAASAATRSALDALVDQELSAQAARKEGLDRDPRVLQMFEATRRQLLAQAYQEKVAKQVIEPSDDEIDRYYDAHPELFARRRLYLLQEWMVTMPSDAVAALSGKVATAESALHIGELLRRPGWRHTTRRLSVSPEDLPLGVLPQIAALEDGQSLVLPREGGARVLTVLSSQPAPVARQAARRLITAFLSNERKREHVAQAIRELRAAGKVEFSAPYAAMMGSGGPAGALAK
jgi:EpsD family peptidyl-prolyl cis-trans isomerase